MVCQEREAEWLPAASRNSSVEDPKEAQKEQLNEKVILTLTRMDSCQKSSLPGVQKYRLLPRDTD